MDLRLGGSPEPDRPATVRKRLFIVGCPRSGTTLLQAILASHPGITSFPETHFLPRVVPQVGWRRRLGLPSPGARNELRRLALESGYGGTLPGTLPAILLHQVLGRFVQILDRATLDRKAEYWVEKTPRHLVFTDLIERHVPEPRIIHIVRDPRPTIASLLQVTARHPEEWDGSRTIEQCIERWVADVRLSLRLSLRPRHAILRYEHLVADPSTVVSVLCRKLEIPFDGRMLTDFGATARSLVRRNEPWKNDVHSGRILDGTNTKRRLSPEDEDLVARSTLSVVAEVEQVLARNPNAITLPSDSKLR